MLRNQRNEPLLVAGSANNDGENPQVVLKFPAGMASISLRWGALTMRMHPEFKWAWHMHQPPWISLLERKSL